MKRKALCGLVGVRVRHRPGWSAFVSWRVGASALAAHCLAIGICLGQSPEANRSAANALPVLTNVQQVLRLDAAAARERPHQVDFEAVATEPVVAQPTWLWVQDDTNAVLVVHTNRFNRQPGQRVRVRGVTGRGFHASIQSASVQSAQVEVLGTNALPVPLRLPVAHLFVPAYFGRWIEQEGVVRTVARRGNHYSIALAADDAPVSVLFSALPGEPSPEQWLDQRVRMSGVCWTGIDAEGRAYGFELHVPGTNFVATVTSPARPAPAPAVPSGSIAGTLAAALASFQNLSDPPQSPVNATNTLPLLTNAQQVLDLGIEGARLRPHPVRLIGVVTYPVPNAKWIYVDDGTAGIFVVYTYTDNLPQRFPGQVVWVDGVAGPGPVRPWIAEARLKVLGTAPLPPARKPPAVELARGDWHGYHVEIEGVVRDMTRSSALVLLMASGGHPFEVNVPYSPRAPLPKTWMDARMVVRGVCETQVDNAGRPTSTRIYLSDTNSLTMLRTGSSNSFDVALRQPADYRQNRQPSDDRVRLAGTVLYQSAIGRLFLRDDAGALQAWQLVTFPRRASRGIYFERPASEPLRPGDRVELVGAPAESSFAPLFRDAEYRRLGDGPVPKPVRLSTDQALSGQRDADLVTLSARVIGRETRRVAAVEHEVLLLQEDGTVFEALCELRGTNNLPATPRNAIVEASGICTVQSLASGEMRTLRLWLRDAADLRVLGQAAPWASLLPGRILAVSGGLGALALVWIVALRRQVAQRRQAEEKARRSEATTRTMNYFATSLLERDHEDEILWDLAKNCVSKLGFVDCVIYLLDPERKILVQKAAFGPKSPEGQKILNPITIPLGKGIVGSVARSGKPELLGDTRTDRRYICDDEFRLSEITVPIVAGEQVLGVIDAEHPKENFFTQEHLEILTGIASLCANKLIRVRSEEKLRGLNMDLEKRVADRTAALQESETKFRALYESAGMAVIVHDEHAVLDCNPATLRIFGYSSRDQFVGKHPAELSPPVQPNGEKSMAAAQRHIAEALAKGSHQFEWLSKRGDGSSVPVEIVLTPMQFNGRSVIQAVVQDITERKRAQASLRTVEARKAAVLETALDSIITIDQQGHILDFNPAAERTFGYSRAEALGREMAELIIPPSLRDRHRAGLKRAVKTGADTMMGRRIEISAMRRGGEEFTVELALARIHTDDGPIFTAHIQDISERKRAEAEMERALAHEKELSELKSRFVAMVSHEFRTPLGIIMSSAEILDAYLDRLAPEERRANLKDIFQSSKHMASMMEEVLLLGRVEAGKMTCHPVPLDLVSFCEKLVDEITSATNNQCPIQFSAPKDLPEAQADESLLRHIFNNLLNNAVKYSPTGSPVQFTLDARGALAVFTVRDRGIGIPETDQRQLFQAFHRGRNVGETPGTGLGMVIVKHCVQLHQGKIAFESRETKGTTFAVGLPLFGPANHANGETTRFVRESVQGQVLTLIP